jgi:Helix-turn-helix domain of resolvase
MLAASVPIPVPSLLGPAVGGDPAASAWRPDSTGRTRASAMIGQVSRAQRRRRSRCRSSHHAVTATAIPANHAAVFTNCCTAVPSGSAANLSAVSPRRAPQRQQGRDHRHGHKEHDRGRHGGRPSVLAGHKLQVAQEMYASGQYTVATIAKTLGVSRASIYRHLATCPG